MRSQRADVFWFVCAVSVVFHASEQAHADVHIVVNNLDQPGEGFNDPQPFAPVGANTATTLGDARLRAFRHATTILSLKLKTALPLRPVTIEVDARFDPMECSATSAQLGGGGTTTIHRNFPNAPLADAWFPQALANSIAGTDLNVNDADIRATFNADLDDASCLGSTSWYYGFDGKPPTGDVDLVTIALHELAHGLGFQSFMDVSTGARPSETNDAFLLQLEQHNAIPNRMADMTSDLQRANAITSGTNLHWLGAQANSLASTLLTSGMSAGHMQIFAPSQPQVGSSASHLSETMSPNQLMEPYYTGPNHDIALTLVSLQDIGWGPRAIAVPATPGWTRLLLLVALLMHQSIGRLFRRGKARLSLQRTAARL